MASRKPAKSKIRDLNQPGLLPGDPVWAYLRHSPGEEQDIRSQRRAAEQYCQERSLIVAGWYMDEARSGGTAENRAQFEAMMAASRQQPPPVKAIVIWDWGRFSRDDLEAQFFSADLRLRGYQILSVHDDIPAGEFSGIFEAFIRWKNWRYLVDLQANIMRGMDNAVYSDVMVDGQLRCGLSGGGFPPVGYEAHQVQIGVKPSGQPQILVYRDKAADPDLRARVEKAWAMAIEAARAVHRPVLIEIQRECAGCSNPTAASTTCFAPLPMPECAGSASAASRTPTTPTSARRTSTRCSASSPTASSPPGTPTPSASTPPSSLRQGVLRLLRGPDRPGTGEPPRHLRQPQIAPARRTRAPAP